MPEPESRLKAFALKFLSFLLPIPGRNFVLDLFRRFAQTRE
jgi:hypothetical protein